MNTTLTAEDSAVELTGCLATCGTAPVAMVNEQFHKSVTEEKVDEILERLR